MLQRRIRPAGRHGLGLGPEADALHAMHVRIAEQRLLPATEGVERHRYWNWYVDTNHTYLNSTRKFTSNIAIACEARDAITKFMGVDEIDSLAKVFNANA